MIAQSPHPSAFYIVVVVIFIAAALIAVANLAQLLDPDWRAQHNRDYKDWLDARHRDQEAMFPVWIAFKAGFLVLLLVMFGGAAALLGYIALDMWRIRKARILASIVVASAPALPPAAPPRISAGPTGSPPVQPRIYGSPLGAQPARPTKPTVAAPSNQTPTGTGTMTLGDTITLGLDMHDMPVTIEARNLGDVFATGSRSEAHLDIMLLLLAQLLARRRRVLLADPQGIVQSRLDVATWNLVARALMPYPRSATTIPEVIDWLADEVRQREAIRSQNQPVGAPIYLFVPDVDGLHAMFPQTRQPLEWLMGHGAVVNIFVVAGPVSSPPHDPSATVYLVRSGSVVTPSRQSTQSLSDQVLLAIPGRSARQQVRIPHLTNQDIVTMLSQSGSPPGRVA